MTGITQQDQMRLEDMENTLRGSDLDAMSREYFTKYVRELRDDLLHPAARWFTRTGLQQTRLNEDELIFALRTLVDHGMNQDYPAEKIGAADISHPFINVVQQGWDQVAGAMIAAGFDPSQSISADGITHSPAASIARNHSRCLPVANHMLDAVVSDLQERRVSPEAMLITPQGIATWQALGLAKWQRLDGLFDEKQAASFGGRKEQLAFASRLTEAFERRNSKGFDATGMLRDEMLERPDTTAMVSYLTNAQTQRGAV